MGVPAGVARLGGFGGSGRQGVERRGLGAFVFVGQSPDAPKAPRDAVFVRPSRPVGGVAVRGLRRF